MLITAVLESEHAFQAYLVVSPLGTDGASQPDNSLAGASPGPRQ